MGALGREIRGFLYAFLLYLYDKKAKNNANILKNVLQKFANIKIKQYLCTVQTYMSGRMTARCAVFLMSVCVVKA